MPRRPAAARCGRRGGAEPAQGWLEHPRVVLVECFAALAANNAADLHKTPESPRGPCFPIDNLSGRPRVLVLGFPLAPCSLDVRRSLVQGHRRQDLDRRPFDLPAYPGYSFSEPPQARFGDQRQRRDICPGSNNDIQLI